MPLLLKLPQNRQAGLRVRARASLIDVVPTILTQLGVRAPLELDGVDLVRLATEPSSMAVSRPLFFELNRAHHDGVLYVAQGVLEGPHIERLLPSKQRLLFDLEHDPGETSNLYQSLPVRAAELAGLLQDHQRRAEQLAIPENLQERLRALGYVN